MFENRYFVSKHQFEAFDLEARCSHQVIIF